MKSPAYTPDVGDIVWCDFDPQAGHEQAGRRPALVLSPLRYNGLVGLFVCCPVTTKIKGYTFEVALAGLPASVVLADQVRSFDWRLRHVVFKQRATMSELEEVRMKLASLINLG